MENSFRDRTCRGSSNTVGSGGGLMTPSTYSVLSRARSVPLAITSASSDLPPATSEDTTTTTGSFDATQPTTQYTVVATDCRRSALLMNHSFSHHKGLKRAGDSKCSESSTSNTAHLSSFGSFGGNDADQEDNVEDNEKDKEGNLITLCAHVAPPVLS